MPVPALYIMTIAVLLGIGFAGGYSLSAKISAGNLAQCESDKKTMLLNAEQESNQRIKAAAEQTDTALAYAMQRITEAEQQNQEARNELKKHTIGRACISGDTRRVLEQSSAFERQRLPEDAESTAARTAAAAADPGDGDRDSTDADIAEWINDASTLYAQCIARLEAILHWDAGLNGHR